MGLFDRFNQSKEKNSFDSFPGMENYQLFLFVNGFNAKEQMDKYHEIYNDETAFSTEIYNRANTSWMCIVFTLKTDAIDISPIWEYLNTLLWMSEGSTPAFAYAYPKQEGDLPIIAYRDEGSKFGDSCVGIANGRYFQASIPDQEVVWGQSVPEQFDYEGFLSQSYGIDLKATFRR
ncbi:MAG: hypothetical protein K6E91_07590 [Butyrivibrio sp.]|nr:hypothetical protein [Butyrivibrio sp.]